MEKSSIIILPSFSREEEMSSNTGLKEAEILDESLYTYKNRDRFFVWNSVLYLPFPGSEHIYIMLKVKHEVLNNKSNIPMEHYHYDFFSLRERRWRKMKMMIKKKRMMMIVTRRGKKGSEMEKKVR